MDVLESVDINHCGSCDQDYDAVDKHSAVDNEKRVKWRIFKQTKKYSFKTPCGKECYPCWATRREPDFVELGSMQDLREERKVDEELDASFNHCRSEKVQGISKNSKKTKIAKHTEEFEECYVTGSFFIYEQLHEEPFPNRTVRQRIANISVFEKQRCGCETQQAGPARCRGNRR